MIEMTITLNVEISKSEINNFSELVQEIYRTSLEVGQQLLRTALEKTDDELLSSRDAGRYRCKGFQKTCIKTILGAVEYKRRVYVDTAAVETKRCVHLLDEELGIKKVGLVSAEICELVASTITETTYRGTSELISNATGLDISAQGVWDIVQKIGSSQSAVLDRQAELAQAHKGVGTLVSKILYEENDGVWLKLQGKSREEHGQSKEMKVGIAYDGVRWTETKSGKRRALNHKIAYASFKNATEFRKVKEGLVASRFDTKQIQLRVCNGDGANWIRNKNSENCIDVLDEFHRNKKIMECVRDPEFAALLRTHLHNKDIDLLLDCIEAQINSLTDVTEIEKMRDLQRYYTENKDSLLGYYDRDIPIPETREPGVIHHARLGSMESNIFTLIGNRMKGRRACWSENGANNLAILLCQKHTIGFENLFAKLPERPEKEPEFVDTLPLLGSGKIPKTEGKGYELPHQLTVSGTSGWLSSFLKELTKHNNF